MTVFVKGPIELRLGDYREVLGGVEPDAVICDPPYSARTHAGARTLGDYRGKERGAAWRAGRSVHGQMPKTRFELAYYPIDRVWASTFAERWSTARDWIVICGDHETNRWWEESLGALGLVTFAPVPWVRTDSAPRFAADGPANACEWIAIARPKGFPRQRGSRPGYYRGSIYGEKIVTGGKPLWLMRALVRDYSRPGDLICDPCAGGATTLIAAALEGRRSIGAEIDPDTYAKACARIQRTALTPPLPFTENAPMDGEQEGLFDGQ